MDGSTGLMFAAITRPLPGHYGSSLGFTVDLAFSWPANRQILKVDRTLEVDPILEVDPTLEVDPKENVRESHSKSRSP